MCSSDLWSFAGVRPLYDDGSADASEVTRDYVLEVDGADSRAPVLSVFGGKLTTYRKLAEQALERIAPFFPGLKPPWTARTPLPGGDMRGGFDAFAADAARTYTWLPTRDLMALARRHGTRLDMVLDDASSIADLGQPFGAGLYSREVDFFVAHEWARGTDDILYRRTKAGLHMTQAQRDAVASYLGRTSARAVSSSIRGR